MLSTIIIVWCIVSLPVGICVGKFLKRIRQMRNMNDQDKIQALEDALDFMLKCLAVATADKPEIEQEIQRLVTLPGEDSRDVIDASLDRLEAWKNSFDSENG
jgi:uncharacterized protein YneF (UPF0154 family)